MLSPVEIAFLVGVAVTASAAGSIAGTGGTAILLPPMVYFLGVKDAIPLVTLCNLTANFSRAALNWSEVDRRAVFWFAIAGVPLAIVGTYIFVISPPAVIQKLLGIALIVALIARRRGFVLKSFRDPRPFAFLGGSFGFLYGMTEGIGALMAPVFLAYGLVKGAYIGTDALATFFVQATKIITLGSLDSLRTDALYLAAALVPAMVAGSWLGKVAMRYITPQLFVIIVEVAIGVTGVWFLLS
ncbi:MAG: sulfite exporter TauE/SafE family protein [Pseudomonadota bacterium]